MSVDKVEIVSPPAYISQPPPVGGNNNEVKKRSYTRHVIAAVVSVVLLALLIGGILGGIYLQNQSAKDLIKEFTVTTKGRDGKLSEEKVKINAKDNEEEHSSDHGKLHILEDYNKGLVVMRTTFAKLACYLKPLNKSGVTEPKALKDYKDALKEADVNLEETAGSNSSVAYTPSDDAVEDRSFLSARAQELCKGLDVYWMFPAENAASETERVKREQRICWYRYYWRYICITRLYYNRITRRWYYNRRCGWIRYRLRLCRGR